MRRLFEMVLFHHFPLMFEVNMSGGAGGAATGQVAGQQQQQTGGQQAAAGTTGGQQTQASGQQAQQTVAGQQVQSTQLQVPTDLAEFLTRQGEDPTKLDANGLRIATKMFDHHKTRVAEANKDAQTWRERVQANDQQRTEAVLREIFGNENVSAAHKDELKSVVMKGVGMAQTVDLLQMTGKLDPQTANMLRTADPAATQQALALLNSIGYQPQGQQQQGAQMFQQNQGQQANNPLAAILGQLQGQQGGAQNQQQQSGNWSLDDLAAKVAQHLMGNNGVGADLNGQQGTDGSQFPAKDKLFETYAQSTPGNPQVTAMFGQNARTPIGGQMGGGNNHQR